MRASARQSIKRERASPMKIKEQYSNLKRTQGVTDKKTMNLSKVEKFPPLL